MIHELYYKINEFHATFISLREEFLQLDTQLDIKVALNHKKYSPIRPILTEHLACLSKAGKKLPSWLKNNCIFSKVPFEQCSSEAISNFRASILPKGKVLSLTGGLGVDDIAFAKAGSKVTSMDIDPGLNALFNYNLEKLKVNGVRRLTQSAEDFLKENKEIWDLIFVDPDRRAGAHRATSDLSEYVPDFLALLKDYSHFGKRWVIKLSPMLDITWLKNHISYQFDIWVLASGGEVKELMLCMEADSSGKIKMAEVATEKAFVWDGSKMDGLELADHLLFLEASAAAIKCDFNKDFSSLFNLQSLNSNRTFFSGFSLLPKAIARCFILKEMIHGSLGKMKTELNKLGIKKANITTRDFVLNSIETRTKLELKDGGDIYLFFTGKTDKCCYVCEKGN